MGASNTTIQSGPLLLPWAMLSILVSTPQYLWTRDTGSSQQPLRTRERCKRQEEEGNPGRKLDSTVSSFKINWQSATTHLLYIQSSLKVFRLPALCILSSALGLTGILKGNLKPRNSCTSAHLQACWLHCWLCLQQKPQKRSSSSLGLSLKRADTVQSFPKGEVFVHVSQRTWRNSTEGDTWGVSVHLPTLWVWQDAIWAIGSKRLPWPPHSSAF